MEILIQEQGDGMDERTRQLIDEFEQRFGSDATHVSIAPGRVNLIGEHTDYNDGFVLPIAIKRDVQIVLRPRTDSQVHLYSAEYDSTIKFRLDSLQFNKKELWGNYVQGVAWSLTDAGMTLSGFDGLVSGNVPRASGLSSSAALEISTANAFLTVSGQSDALPGTEIARLAQRAENEFVGVNCGIMDQFISQLGADGSALLIDCRSLDYRLIPVPPEAALVIGNTKASRSLADSAYNERRAQCEEGVALLQRVLPDIQALRDVSSEQLAEHRSLLPEVIYQRCHHVVTENERVMETIDALSSGDLARVGALMSASHASLRDDYEVSSDALNTMVEAMEGVEGCYGARLTGAGFGGCAVALVKPGAEQSVADAIYQEYPKAVGIWPEVYLTQASDGARVVELGE